MLYLLQAKDNAAVITAIISGGATIIVAIVTLFLNARMANKNKEQELLMKNKELEQKEYLFLLENLKSFWEYQNRLYSEMLKVVSKLVLDEDVASYTFLENYKRFWELYWSELPAVESPEIASAMVAIKELIYKKKHLSENDKAGIADLKEPMNFKLLELSQAVRKSSLLLEYSESLKHKIQKSSARSAGVITV